MLQLSTNMCYCSQTNVWNVFQQMSTSVFVCCGLLFHGLTWLLTNYLFSIKLNASLALNSLLLIAGIIEFLVAITSAAMCCSALCWKSQAAVVCRGQNVIFQWVYSFPVMLSNCYWFYAFNILWTFVVRSRYRPSPIYSTGWGFQHPWPMCLARKLSPGHNITILYNTTWHVIQQ